MANGKISYEEFQILYQGLESRDQVIVYSDNNPENEELANAVEGFRDSVEYADKLTRKLSPVLFCGAAASLIGSVVFDGLNKHYSKQILKCKQEEQLDEEQEEMGE